MSKKNTHQYPTVIYITGSHRSGSTLLDMILGSHPNIFSMGEIVRLKKYFKNNRRCNCGEKILQCTIWPRIQKIIQDDLGIMSPCKILKPIYTKDELIKGLLNMNLNCQFQVSISYDHALLKAVSDISNNNIMVDSSKSISRLLYYLIYYRGVVIYIHLIRDPRAVINSLLRNHNYNYYLLNQYILWWRKTQMRIKNVFYVINTRYKFLIKYEDFCKNPSGTIIPIFNCLGLQYNPEVLNYLSYKHHNISGNMGTKTTKEKKLKIQESWKTELPAEYKTIIEKRLKRLMKKYYYS